MGPTAQTPQTDEMFRPRLDEQLKMTHPLIRLSSLMDWQRIEADFSQQFVSTRGRPALSPRLIAGLLYLQHANDTSDEAVVATWLENPTGNTFAVKRICKPSCPLTPRA